MFNIAGQDQSFVSAWTSLDPYAQLVKSLLPRAAAVRVFDANAELRWSSEATTGPDLPRLIAESAQRAQNDRGAAGLLHAAAGCEPVYLWWLRDDASELIATVAVTTRTAQDGEVQPFHFVNALIKAALECLRRELAAQSNMQRLSSQLSSSDRDMKLLMSVSAQSDQPSGDQDDLKTLLQTAADHLKCKLSALIVPEKSIALIRGGAGQTPDGSVLARTHRQLLQMAQSRRKSIIVNRVSESSTGASKGPALPYRILCCPIRHPSGRVMGVMALFRESDDQEFAPTDVNLADILARKATSIIEANFDALSGLLTRGALEQRVRSSINEPGRTGSWSALYIDSDQLHVINESCGMHVGDAVIAQIGEMIRNRMPAGGLAARISGDRFAVLLPQSPQQAGKFAEVLRQSAEQLSAMNGSTRLHVALTIGVAPLDTSTSDLAHALAEAESACKAGKDRGRNRVEIYQDADLSIIRRHTDISTAGDLRDAIAANRMRLDAQLILPIGTQEMTATPHFELLVRMLTIKGDTIGPDRFMSAAHRYQLMPSIDRWVIENAIAMLQPHADLLVNLPVVFTINLSGQSLNEETFADYLLQHIETSGLEPGLFCFELTETAAVASIEKAELLMRRLRKLGCGVALDDFGTGLSSLSYLRALPVTILKIDGSFVRDILKDPRSESMVQAIAQLARTMGIVTVAEYVETDEIRARIATLGVDYGQGFAIGKPVPLPEVLAELPLYAAAMPVYRPVEDTVPAEPPNLH